ncbi:unnamed protein product [Sphagnum troendelagicum]|uniref:DUF7748 domain-containing protein n=1 Tax=Sphagnum troendelagicum TaxID=128251 RepID=A0ABP0UG81_9BRYO
MRKVQVELVNRTGEVLRIREEVAVGCHNTDVTLDGYGGCTTIEVDPNRTYFVAWVIKDTDGSNAIDLNSDQLIDNERITIFLRNDKYELEMETRSRVVDVLSHLFTGHERIGQSIEMPSKSVKVSGSRNIHAPNYVTPEQPPAHKPPVAAEPAASPTHVHRGFLSSFRRFIASWLFCGSSSANIQS